MVLQAELSPLLDKKMTIEVIKLQISLMECLLTQTSNSNLRKYPATNIILIFKIIVNLWLPTSFNKQAKCKCLTNCTGINRLCLTRCFLAINKLFAVLLWAHKLQACLGFKTKRGQTLNQTHQVVIALMSS